jgi:hypothetical protein
MRWRPGEDGAILPCCGLHELLLLFFIPDLEKNGDRMTLAMEKGRARQGRESERGNGKLWTKADQYGLEGSGDTYWEVSGDRDTGVLIFMDLKSNGSRFSRQRGTSVELERVPDFI